MLTMDNSDYPYLIFVPKNSMIKPILDKMTDSEMMTKVYKFKVNKDKTTFRGETTLAFLKQIFDPRKEKTFDWTFATNQETINLDYIIPTYK